MFRIIPAALATVTLTLALAAPAAGHYRGERSTKEQATAAKKRLGPHKRMFRYWSRQPIADCTWVGESSPPGDYSGQFALRRYRVFNSSGSGARGKFQFLPSTYAAYCRFCDWSRADQERAAHKLYRDQGTVPWAAC